MAEYSIKTEETGCETCGNRGSIPGERIPIARIREKLDALEASRDREGAVRLLNYWLAEARSFGDQNGEVLVENEFVGLYRKAGQGEEALEHGKRAMELIECCGLEGTVTAGTTRINLATACTAFGKAEKAWALFGEARTIYEACLTPGDGRLGGLCNNMGLCAISLRKYAEGRALFEQALKVTAQAPGGEGEAAITCLNLADLVSTEAEEIGDEESLIRAAEETEYLVDQAWQFLNAPSLPRDGYYRFICDKCAPVMAHYGWLEQAEELKARAEG